VKRAAVATVAVVVTTIAFVWLTRPVLRHPLLLASLMMQSPPPRLPVPVEGVAARQITDSWGSPRPGGRHHQGVDIFARRGTPIHSATRGIVVTVGDNQLGGHIVKVFGPGGEWHYYAHLDHFAKVRPGDVVHPGDILGYVGNSGDASTTPCHLHYGIYSKVGRPTDPYWRLRRG
jgi:murein DD-endopeptidase MepM/ murein hydrolase activator NlpD